MLIQYLLRGAGFGTQTLQWILTALKHLHIPLVKATVKTTLLIPEKDFT